MSDNQLALSIIAIFVFGVVAYNMGFGEVAYRRRTGAAHGMRGVYTCCMGWQEEVNNAIDDKGPLQIEIEIPGDAPATEVAEELTAIGDSTDSERTILIGARTVTVDSETGDLVGAEAWRMLAQRGPAQAILGIAASKLDDWADAALRRSKVTLLCTALTIRVYP